MTDRLPLGHEFVPCGGTSDICAWKRGTDFEQEYAWDCGLTRAEHSEARNRPITASCACPDTWDCPRCVYDCAHCDEVRGSQQTDAPVGLSVEEALAHVRDVTNGLIADSLAAILEAVAARAREEERERIARRIEGWGFNGRHAATETAEAVRALAKETPHG